MKVLGPLVTLLLVFGSFQALARNDLLSLDIESALSTPAAKAKLNKGVKFYFGETRYPEITQSLSPIKTNKKTNAFNKTDEEACQWVFLSAMLSLQALALKQGGDAVVDIESNYKGNPVSDSQNFQCGAGNIIAGVALKGRVVRLTE